MWLNLAQRMGTGDPGFWEVYLQLCVQWAWGRLEAVRAVRWCLGQQVGKRQWGGQQGLGGQNGERERE